MSGTKHPEWKWEEAERSNTRTFSITRMLRVSSFGCVSWVFEYRKKSNTQRNGNEPGMERKNANEEKSFWLNKTNFFRYVLCALLKCDEVPFSSLPFSISIETKTCYLILHRNTQKKRKNCTKINLKPFNFMHITFNRLRLFFVFGFRLKLPMRKNMKITMF